MSQQPPIPTSLPTASSDSPPPATAAMNPHANPPGAGSDPTATSDSVASPEALDDFSGSPPFPVPGWERFTQPTFLGAGGMGMVFKAWDTRLERFVALKFLTLSGEHRVRRFLREARAQAQLAVDGICRVYDCGVVHGQPFIAMQHIAGPDLSRVAAEMSLEENVLIIRQVAGALQVAHQAGLIHRDLKPSNILVETDADGCRHPFIVDFGLARHIEGDDLTVSGEILGTPAYMSPEQAAGNLRAVDRRSDIYCLGATLYAVLTGEPPVEGTSPLDLIVRAARAETVPIARRLPGIAADLEAIVSHCLEAEPQRRYASARALAEDLGRFLADEPVHARKLGKAARLARYVRRRKTSAAVVAGFFTCAVIMGAMWANARLTLWQQSSTAVAFGRRVDALEARIWKERLSPLHDIGAAREELRAALRRLEDEVRGRRAAVRGPAYAAIGRGYLAIGESEAALERLERAFWLGLRDPETTVALGRAHAAVYLAGLEARDGSAANHGRKREAALWREHLTAALHLLSPATPADVEADAAIPALLAVLRGDYAAAVAQTERAAATHPWLYEAHLLRAQAEVAAARELASSGQGAAAREGWRRAEIAFAAAARVAESEPAAYAGVCRARAAAADFARPPTAPERLILLRETLASCQDALRADPRWLPAYAQMLSVYSTFVQAARARGENAAEVVEQARRAGAAAHRLAPADPRFGDEDTK